MKTNIGSLKKKNIDVRCLEVGIRAAQLEPDGLFQKFGPARPRSFNIRAGLVWFEFLKYKPSPARGFRAGRAGSGPSSIF